MDDAKFLSLVCDIEVSLIKDIALNKCPVDMSKLSKLAEALDVDKESWNHCLALLVFVLAKSVKSLES